ncbi:MAG TPA: hypothetical protein VHS28_03500 [Chloroflexota bacterium]|nr:hypothetical protein [Chloroflexota bacterium]
MTEETKTPAEPAALPLFNAHDRCDKCQAQAHMRALLATGELLFCRHHGNEYRASLIAAGAAFEED